MPTFHILPLSAITRSLNSLLNQSYQDHDQILYYYIDKYEITEKDNRDNFNDQTNEFFKLDIKSLLCLLAHCLKNNHRLKLQWLFPKILLNIYK